MTAVRKNQKLVFIHGWATDSWVWRNHLKEFSKGYDVAALELYGCGKGDKWNESTLKPAVDKVLKITHNGLHNTDFIGIGWSLGASVLMSIAIKKPEIFKGLILVGATPCFVKRNNFLWGQPRGVVKRMIKDMKTDFKKALSRFYPLNFTDKELSAKEASGFIRHYNIPTLSPLLKTHDSSIQGQAHRGRFQPKALFTSLDALTGLDIRKDIKKIKAKTLIIHGDKDNVCPVDAGRYIAKNIDGSCLKVFKDTGHMPFLLHEELFNQTVRRFLKRL